MGVRPKAVWGVRASDVKDPSSWPVKCYCNNCGEVVCLEDNAHPGLPAICKTCIENKRTS